LYHNLSPFKRPFSRWIWVSRYQNVSILDFIGAKDDGGGGDNWSYKTCKAPVKSSPPTNQHPVFLQAGCPSCDPTNSVKSTEGKKLVTQLTVGNKAPYMATKIISQHQVKIYSRSRNHLIMNNFYHQNCKENVSNLTTYSQLTRFT